MQYRDFNPETQTLVLWASVALVVGLIANTVIHFGMSQSAAFWDMAIVGILGMIAQWVFID